MWVPLDADTVNPVPAATPTTGNVTPVPLVMPSDWPDKDRFWISFVVLASTAVIVAIPSKGVPVVAIVIPLPSDSVNEPPVLDNVDTWVVAVKVFAIVCSSFVVLASVAVIVNV